MSKTVEIYPGDNLIIVIEDEVVIADEDGDTEWDRMMRAREQQQITEREATCATCATCGARVMFRPYWGWEHIGPCEPQQGDQNDQEER